MLKRALIEAQLDWDKVQDEAIYDALYTPSPSKFINLHGLDKEIHLNLLPLHEKWTGDNHFSTHAFPYYVFILCPMLSYVLTHY